MRLCVCLCNERNEWGHRLWLQRLPAQGLLEYKQPLSRPCVECSVLHYNGCVTETHWEKGKGERLSDNLYWLGISFTNSPPAVAIANRRVAHKIYLKWVVCIYHICIFVSYKAINKPYIRLTAAANSLLGPFWCHGFTSAHSNKPWWKCAVRLNKGSKSAKIHCGECGVWAFVSIFEIYV